jgi:hypothetical protein
MRECEDCGTDDTTYEGSWIEITKPDGEILHQCFDCYSDEYEYINNE